MQDTILPITVKSYDCSQDKYLTFYNLLQYMQEAAYINANILGLGFKELLQQNKYWVLSNIKLEIKKMPKWDDDIKLQTWSCGANKLVAFRDFFIKDNNDDILIKAASEWLTIDATTRRPRRLQELNLPIITSDKRAIDEKLQRINPSTLENLQKIYEISVPYSSIDENGHVNNAEYIKWAFDALYNKQIKTENIESIQISYLNELLINQTMDIYYTQQETSVVLVGKNADDQANIFALKVN